MADDGCREVAWKGQAFPYLMHKADPVSHNYGEAKGSMGTEGKALPSNGNGSDVSARAAAGTWQGAAPRGFLSADKHGTIVAPEKPSIQVPEARGMRLGSARIPKVGFGTWQLTGEQVKQALEVGYTHIDCATAYNNETVVGEALSETIQGGKRDQLFITGKVFNDAHSPAAVRAACEKSIKDLGCSYLDLYLMHWPVAWKAGTQETDPDASIEETWAAMEKLVDDGLVRQIGVSNFSLKEVEDLMKVCRIKPVANQVELHPLLAQRKLVGVLMRMGVQCIAYSPLGSTSKTQMRDHPVVKTLADKKGKTATQMMLKWGIQRGTPVVVKASSLQHMQENFDIFDWKLDEYEKVKMDELNEDIRMVNPPWHVFPHAEEGGLTKPSVALGDGKHYT